MPVQTSCKPVCDDLLSHQCQIQPQNYLGQVRCCTGGRGVGRMVNRGGESVFWGGSKISREGLCWIPTHPRPENSAWISKTCAKCFASADLSSSTGKAGCILPKGDLQSVQFQHWICHGLYMDCIFHCIWMGKAEHFNKIMTGWKPH